MGESLSFNVSDKPLGKGLIALILLSLWALHLIIYAPAVRVQPFGDDFSVLREIDRGNDNGPLDLVLRSSSSLTYRPIRSVGVWAFAKISYEHRVFFLHVLGFLGAALFFFAGYLWLVTVPLRLPGVIAAGAGMMFHPILVASIVSLDTVDSTLSTGMLWIGVWMIYRWRENIPLAAGGAALMFALGCITKEYIFAMAPVGVWTIWWMYERRRLWAVLLIIGPLCLLVAALFIIRYFTMPADQGFGSVYLLKSFMDPLRNTAVFALGILYFGNTVWAFFHRSQMEVLAGIALAMLATVAVIVWGIRLGWAREPHRWIYYFFGCLLLSTLPALLMFHISEVYLPPLVLPFAMLIGFAADGFARANSGWKIIGATAAIALLGCSIFTIRAKIERMYNNGERARWHMDQVLSFVPADARNMKIVTVFNVALMPRPPRTYSVFQLSDEVLLIHENCLDWLRPGKNLDFYMIRRPQLLKDMGWDLILFWDIYKQQYYIPNRRDIIFAPPDFEEQP